MSQEHQLTTINFCGINFPAPDELPLPQYGSRMKRRYMCNGEELLGLCLREPLGVHISYGTFEFRLAGCTRAQVETMAAAHFNQWTPKVLTFHSPDGDQSFSVLFSDNGFKPKLKRRSGFNDPRRYDVDIKLEMLAAL